MFHRNLKLSLAVIGLGAGMLLACLLKSSSICVFLGILLVIVGTLLLRKC